MYHIAVLKLLSAPATNDRSPRYMERALVAIHQAQRHGENVTLFYGTSGDRVAQFIECADHLEEIVTDPIAASYPNCTLTTVENLDETPPGWRTWTAKLELCPEIFPILRHAQFEDFLNGTFADPVSGILRAVKPGEGIRSSVAIRIVPAGRRRRRAASEALRLLDREFFRKHHRLVEHYAEHITRRHHWLPAWLLGLLARQSPHGGRTTLATSGS